MIIIIIIIEKRKKNRKRRLICQSAGGAVRVRETLVAETAVAKLSGDRFIAHLRRFHAGGRSHLRPRELFAPPLPPTPKLK